MSSYNTKLLPYFYLLVDCYLVYVLSLKTVLNSIG